MDSSQREILLYFNFSLNNSNGNNTNNDYENQNKNEICWLKNSANSTIPIKSNPLSSSIDLESDIKFNEILIQEEQRQDQRNSKEEDDANVEIFENDVDENNLNPDNGLDLPKIYFSSNSNLIDLFEQRNQLQEHVPIFNFNDDKNKIKSFDCSDSNLKVFWFLIFNNFSGSKFLSIIYLKRIILPILKKFTKNNHHSNHQIKIFESLNENILTELEKIKLNLQKENENHNNNQGNRHKTKIFFVTLGGDGTISDLINQILLKDEELFLNLNLIVIPLGTSNALFHSINPKIENCNKIKDKLQSFINGLNSLNCQEDAQDQDQESKSIKILPISKISIINSSGSVLGYYFSIVVTSTSLHASILKTFDELRSNDDTKRNLGIEVFKEAFLKNSFKTWNSKVELIPINDNQIQIYDSKEKSFKNLSLEDNNVINLQDDFSYFTSCSIDRLESRFLLTPFKKFNHLNQFDNDTSTSENYLDLIIIRPKRFLNSNNKNLTDNNNSNDQDEDKKIISNLLLKIMDDVYDNSNHLNLVDQSTNQNLVEYYRCNGWRWKPIVIDNRNNYEICIDGKIIEIESENLVECKIFNLKNKKNILIY